MELAQIDQKCKELKSARQELLEKRATLQKLEIEAKKKTREAQILEELAKLRGEEFKGEHELEELKKAKTCIEDCQKRVEQLEHEIFEGLKNVNFPIPLELPKIDASGRSVVNFEGPPNDCAVDFLATTLSSNVPLILDRTELHSDKIVVSNVREPFQVVEQLKALQRNISRLAQSSLGKDPDVEETVEYIHGSCHRQFWEITKGRKKITYDDLCSELNLKASKERKIVRNFFTNLEISLKDKFPFIRLEPGVYELAFFGSLVWKRYQDKYPSEKEITEDSPSVEIVEESTKKKEKEVPTLNHYLSNNEIKDIIYGKGANQ